MATVAAAAAQSAYTVQAAVFDAGIPVMGPASCSAERWYQALCGSDRSTGSHQPYLRFGRTGSSMRTTTVPTMLLALCLTRLPMARPTSAHTGTSSADAA